MSETLEQRRSLAARIDHWARAHPWRLNLSVTGAIWLVCGLGSAVVAGPVGLVVVTLTILPLAVRHKHPVEAMYYSVGVFAVQLVVLRLPLPANIAQAIMIYTVAVQVASLPVRLFTLGAAIIGTLLGGFRWSTPPGYLQNALGTASFLALLATLIWVIGNLVRGRDANLRALQAAKMHLDESRLEHEKFAAQQQRVAAAREIHDIVAHSLTVVIVQADGAEYVAEHANPWDRQDAREVLATIGRTARSALSEVRGVIDILRDTDAVPERPRPVDVAELLRLIDAVRAAGLPVEVAVESTMFDRSPSLVQFAVLRVVRESLTNVLKHAGQHACARVVVQQRQGAVQVRIEDDGVGDLSIGDKALDRESDSGHGLNGMRERVRALGGVLTAGPRPGRGFVVDATIPLAHRSAPAQSVGLACPSIRSETEGRK